MKKVLFLLMVLVTVLGITACNPFHTHMGNGEYTVAKEPTCTEDGESQMLCTECGEVAVTVPIPATGHTEVIIPAVEPTCTETGLTEGKYCSVCDTVIVKPSVVAARHSFDDFVCILCGEEYTSSGLNYKSNGAGTCIVVGIGSCTDKDIFIPSVSPKGDLVTGIDAIAFYNNYYIKSVTIPDSVTSIGDYAFHYCESLTSVNIPNRVTSIGDNAFYGCGSLASITLPTNLTSIGANAFVYCKSLTGITIPNSVTSIGNYAFYDCKLLSCVTIGNSVTSIGYYAFYGCNTLTSITIPKSVIHIGENAFAYSSLTTLEFEGTVEQWNAITKGDYWNYKIGDYTIYCTDGEIANDGTVTYYEVASEGLEFTLNDDGEGYSVTGIGTCNDTEVIIPSTYNGKPVTRIADSAFFCCLSLTSIEIPNGVLCISDYAFAECPNLTTIVISDSVTTIGDHAFYSCGKLTSAVIPDRVTTIGAEAFSMCGSISSVVIPNMVTTVGVGAFSYCNSLTSVVIPDSVTFIGDWAFAFCNSLTSIDVSRNNKHYKSIDGNLYTIDEKTLIQYALGKRDTNFVIPDSVTSIGDWVFYGCDILTTIVISDSVTYIGDWTFFNCDSLTTIVIPDSVTTIGEFAFMSCTSLTTIEFKGTVEQWNTISFGVDWNISVPATYVQCSDGTVPIK